MALKNGFSYPNILIVFSKCDQIADSRIEQSELNQDKQDIWKKFSGSMIRNTSSKTGDNVTSTIDDFALKTYLNVFGNVPLPRPETMEERRAKRPVHEQIQEELDHNFQDYNVNLEQMQPPPRSSGCC